MYENIWAKSILHGKFKAFNYLCIKLVLWIHTITEMRRVLFWFRVEKQTNQKGQLSRHFLLKQGTLCMDTPYVPWHLLCRPTFRGKIYPNYRDQSNITPCLGSFAKVLKVLKAVKQNAMSSNKACEYNQYGLSWAVPGQNNYLNNYGLKQHLKSSKSNKVKAIQRRSCLQQKSPLTAGIPTLRNARTLTQNDNRASAGSIETDESGNDEYDRGTTYPAEEQD